MGQGTHTGLAQLVAEELECDWKKIVHRADHARPEPGAQARLARHVDRRQPRHPRLAGLRPPGRRRGAHHARAGGGQRMAGAGERADRGERHHHARGLRTLDELRQGRGGRGQAARAGLQEHQAQESEGVEDRRQAVDAARHGRQGERRQDVCRSTSSCRACCTPRSRQCPVFGGKLVSYDESKIKGRRGVQRRRAGGRHDRRRRRRHWWRAKTALDALPIVWDEGAGAKQSSATIAAHLKEGLTANDAFADTNDGDALKAIAGAAKKVEAVYSTPFLSARLHGADELHRRASRRTRPKSGCRARTRRPRWPRCRRPSGLPLAQCEAYNHGLGGGFGRRGGTQDYVRQGAAIAQAVPGRAGQDDLEPRGRPGARFLPADLAVQDGRRPRRERQSRRVCTSACPGSRSTPMLAPHNIKDGKDRGSCRACGRSPATRRSATPCPTCCIEYAMRNTHVPVGPWRGVNTNQNGALPRVLHGRSGARGRQGFARIPPRADAEPSRSTWPC